MAGVVRVELSAGRCCFRSFVTAFGVFRGVECRPSDIVGVASPPPSNSECGECSCLVPLPYEDACAMTDDPLPVSVCTNDWDGDRFAASRTDCDLLLKIGLLRPKRLPDALLCCVAGASELVEEDDLGRVRGPVACISLRKF